MWVILSLVTTVAAFGNEKAWYASSSRTSLSTDPGVFVANTAIDLCTLPPDTGGCTKELVRYYYDHATDDCKRFTFSGCGGNSNRFMRRTHCRSRCVRNRHSLHSLHEPSYLGASGANHREPKHRRMLTTTTPTTTTTSTTTSTTTTTTRPPPVTPAVKRIEKVEITPPIQQCPHCDPLFGVCVDGECGCMRGFKKLGLICIDENECDDGSICPSNSRCTNTIGSYRCDCDAGFNNGGECKIVEESCDDIFDILLTEEDCNNGEQAIRYYYDHETASCRKFFYGGCKSTSRNIFNDLQTCNTLCMGRNVKTPDQESRQITIPQKLNLDLDSPTTTPTAEEKKLEATKIVKIMTHINPNENRCARAFDEDLRVECVNAEWAERFFWNPLVRECEPFWYDSSCDIRDTAGKNFFETLEHCRSECGEELGGPAEAKEEVAEKTPIVPSVEESEKEVETPKEDKKDEAPTAVEEKEIDIDPLGLIATTVTKMVPTAPAPAISQNGSSNFVAKTPIVKFDRAKYMEEFLQKLNALPDSSKKLVLDISSYSTKRPPFTLNPALFGPADNVKEAHLTSPVDSALFKEVTPVPAKMPDAFGYVKTTTADPFDLSKFVTKKALFTLNPAIFGELLDTSVTGEGQPVKQATTISLPTTTADPLDLSKFVTKRPPFRLYIEDDIETTTSDVKITTTTRKPAQNLLEGGTTHDPLDLSKFVTKRPPFTLNPALFNIFDEEEITTSAPIATHKKDRNHYEIQDLDSLPVHDIVPIRKDAGDQQTTTTVPTATSFQDFVTSEKQKITSLLDELNKPVDLCEEPLHPTLEEDCSNEQWVLRWYFNSDRGSCKTFWYGGCPPTEARNFFASYALCKATCAHKMPAEDGFNPKYVVRPETTTTTTTKMHTTSIPAIERSFKSQSLELGEEVLVPKDSAEDEEKAKKQRDLTTTRGPVTEPLPPVARDFESPGRDQSPASDACSAGYDEKWDEDCSGDNWQVRSYFDLKTKSCKRFWWGGCSTDNLNIWKDQQTCLTACAHKLPKERIHTTAVPLTIDGTSDGPSNMVLHPAIFELPQASALVGDASLTEDLLPPIPKKSRKNRHKFDLKMNVVHTTYEVVKAPSRSRWGIQNDAPVPDEAEPAFATKEHFEVDLQHQLANKKREHENRADLAYSSAVQHPVTVASECLEDFDKFLAKTCNNGSVWTNRYFYDRDLRVCRMFWSDGCFSTSRNNFPDMETCQWKCEGRHPEPEKARACLDKFDINYLEDCRQGEYGNRFYFDHDRKRCTAFHWGGCRSDSINFFVDLGDCQEMCERPPRHLTQSCLEPFDESYRDACSADGRFSQYYYFDHATHTCKLFWYGNCRGEGQNIYPTLESCQWICERHREERSPGYCMDRFDPKYTESCGGGRWIEKWHFNQKTGDCQSFWWDGCISTSQNIFGDEKTCSMHCVYPGHLVESRLPEPDTKYRCLEPMEIGTCRETYPTYYYDKQSKECKAFAYSGCGGNENRFLTQTQCQGLCSAFEDLSEPEMDCHLPLHFGYANDDQQCLEAAGYRYYFDRDYGRCSQFWFMGCGGNSNNFYSYDVCMRTCRVERRRLERRPRASSTACFKASALSGKCPSKLNKAVQRWTYHNGRCTTFSFSGCGGSENRFPTQKDCEDTCANRKPSADATICSFDPDVGTCNQLRYMWFYNQTRGTCDQFLFGGCDGNPNRFESFEVCQKKCEVSGVDPCLESLDRGNWCEAMSNRYYFNKKSKQCRGFHYTGCGKSGNNFLTAEECHTKCELRYPKKRAAPRRKQPVKSSGYSGVKPIPKTAMLRHIVLNGANKTYYKSDPEWIDYSLCLGYRYNVSGRDTVLNVHLCAHEGDATCLSEILKPTEGEEFCQVLRPFLRGTHLYSWYFGIDVKTPPYSGSGASGRVQRDSETTAVILQLKANHCHDIC